MSIYSFKTTAELQTQSRLSNEPMQGQRDIDWFSLVSGVDALCKIIFLYYYWFFFSVWETDSDYLYLSLLQITSTFMIFNFVIRSQSKNVSKYQHPVHFLCTPLIYIQYLNVPNVDLALLWKPSVNVMWCFDPSVNSAMQWVSGVLWQVTSCLAAIFTKAWLSETPFFPRPKLISSLCNLDPVCFRLQFYLGDADLLHSKAIAGRCLAQ